jgi:hypothetical protein
MIVRKIMNGNCICDRLTDGRTDRQTDGLRNGEETKSPLRLAGWGLITGSSITTICIPPTTVKHCTKFQVSTISHLGGVASTSYFTPCTPLGSTITLRKINDPPVLTTCTFTNDNEASSQVVET